MNSNETAINNAFNQLRDNQALGSAPKPVSGKSLLAPKRTDIKPEPIVNAMVGGKWQFRGDDGKIYQVNRQQKEFVEAYIGVCNGNGVCAIYEAGYKAKNARVASAMASEYLTLPNIYSYLNSLLIENGYNDDNVTKQHLYLINQHGDMKTKAKALDMYFKLKGKYPKEAGGNGNGVGVVGVFSLAELAERVTNAQRMGRYNPDGRVIQAQVVEQKGD